MTSSRRISFSALLLITLLAVSLGGLALVSAVSYGVHRRVVDDLSRALVQQTLQRVSDRLDELVRSAVDLSAFYPQLAPDGELTSADFPDLFSRLWVIVAPREELSYLGVGIVETGDYGLVGGSPGEPVTVRLYVRDPRTGPQVRDYKPTPQGLEPTGTLPWTPGATRDTGYELRLRPHFVQTQRARRSVWTDSYEFFGGDDREPVSGVTYATPLYNAEGQLKLVWNIDLELVSLSRFLARVQGLAFGHLVIAEHRSDGTWKVIARPEWESGHPAATADDDAIATWLARLPSDFQAALRQNGQIQTFSAQGQDWAAAHTALTGPDRPEWLVAEVWPVALQPQPALLSSTEFLIAFCTVGLVASLVAWGVSQLIARPLLALERDAQRLADGHSATISSPGGTLEITRLASTLNELARRVDDRQSRLAQTNSELQISRQRLQWHFDTTPVGAMEMDTRGIILRWNAAAERIFGWSAAEILGQSFDVIVPEPIRPEIHQLWQRLMACSGGFCHDNQNLTKDGHIIDCEWFNTPLLDESGRPFGGACLVLDVTERKRADQEIRRLNAELEHRVSERTGQLAQALDELEAFSYSVAHDLRAPLRSIAGFSQTLEEDCGDRLDAAGGEHLRRIRAATQRMAELIDALLTLAQVSRKETASESVDLSELAQQALQRLRQAEPDRHVDAAIQPGLIVRGDPTLLRVLVNNLIDNAWKYTRSRRPARIEVGQQPAADGPEFFARDNGVGFDPQYADQLFQPFQRLHHSDEFEGHGVGLATVWRIVHKHGGRVRLEGRPDHGATCYFTLSPGSPCSVAVMPAIRI